MPDETTNTDTLVADEPQAEDNYLAGLSGYDFSGNDAVGDQADAMMGEDDPTGAKALAELGDQKPDEKDDQAEEKPEEKPEETPADPALDILKSAAERLGVEELEWTNLEGDVLKGKDALMEVVGAGATYAKMADHFNESAENALSVVASFLGAAIEKFGPELEEFQTLEDLPLDPAMMSAEEKLLARAIKQTAMERNQVQASLAEQLKIVKGLEAEVAEFKLGPSYVAAVQAKYPDAQIDADSVRNLMVKHETKDPVKAYGLELLETGRNPNRARILEAASIPRGGEGKTFNSAEKDANGDPKYTFIDIQKKISQGWRDVAN